METNFKVDAPSFALGYSAGKKKGGGGSMDGFHMVRFFNDDRTTLLYTVFVSTGANAIYAGETPTSTGMGGVFLGFDPSPANVMGDMNCYATYEAVGTLGETSWAAISALSEQGTAENYFAVGDTKMIHVEGTVGTLAVNGDYGVYIIGFDHNEELEGKGIHFGTFKSAESNGIDLCLTDSKYGTYPTKGEKLFNMNHSAATNYGGWAKSEMRCDILGSVDRLQADITVVNASPTCATEPVARTLMAALPADLRAVMKPMTKYTNNVGYNPTEATASVDYLPLLSIFEVDGKASSVAQEEANCQKQYAYFAAGNSIVKYSADGTAKDWYFRTPNNALSTHFMYVGSNGGIGGQGANFVRGIAPIFKV